MVKEIRVYIEGGGDGKNTKALIRQGFSGFLQDIVQLARISEIKWQIIICGSRNNAFRGFKNALKSHPDAFNLLLVDQAPLGRGVGCREKLSPKKRIQAPAFRYGKNKKDVLPFDVRTRNTASFFETPAFKYGVKSTPHPTLHTPHPVHAEAPVKQSPWQHLKSRDNWDSLGVDDTHCHLMVQAMEAWFIADIDTLRKFYGQGFKENAILRNQNVETIDKDSLEPSLKAATYKTSKGEYQKIKHASKLLELLNVAEVRKASHYCDRLFTTLEQIVTPRFEGS